jgi:AcrR family transcriptional regulator
MVRKNSKGPVELPIAGRRPERRDAAENRRRILDAARALVAKGGPEALTMDAVSAAAGVGKGTVFRRFGDRGGLTRALIDDYMLDFQEAFLRGEPPLGPGAPPHDRLVTFVHGLIRLQVDNLPLALAAEATPGREPPPVYGMLATHIAGLVGEIDPDLDAGALAVMILSAVSAPAIAALSTAGGLDTETLEASATVLLRGLDGS